MDHVRIDEGLTRGPRKKHDGIRIRDSLTGRSCSVIPVDLLPSTVLDRYLNDEKTSTIATSYGISRSRLHQWLLEHAEDHWRKAQIARAITALEQAKDDLAIAPDPLELARCREQLRGAQFELERLFSRFFGHKQEVTVKEEIKIEFTLGTEASALLDQLRCVNSVAETPIAALALPETLDRGQFDKR